MPHTISVSLVMGAKDCSYSFERNGHTYTGTADDVAGCMNEVNYLVSSQRWKDDVKYFLCEKEPAGV